MSLTVHCIVIHLLHLFINILDCYYQPVFFIIWTAINNQSSSSIGLFRLSQTTSNILGCCICLWWSRGALGVMCTVWYSCSVHKRVAADSCTWLYMAAVCTGCSVYYMYWTHLMTCEWVTLNNYTGWVHLWWLRGALNEVVSVYTGWLVHWLDHKKEVCFSNHCIVYLIIMFTKCLWCIVYCFLFVV